MMKFFNPSQEGMIIDAIRLAESRTSGEIRIHLEDRPRHGVMQEAQRVFQRLGMHRTRDRNGVLILLAPALREFAIIGDEGINRVVAQDFWQSERDLMQQYFQRGEFTEGLVVTIAEIGEKLKDHFPYQSDDENELPDDISYGSQTPTE